VRGVKVKPDVMLYSAGRYGVRDGTGGMWLYAKDGTPLGWREVVPGAKEPEGPQPELDLSQEDE
jgi:hypothetical protein